jgi:uncharacterized membrane protein YhaH (DUF805 family)
MTWGEFGSVRGRINRATYAAFLAAYVAVFAIAVALQFRIPGEVLLALICVPRLHDLGRSGWWFGVAVLLEVVVVVAGLAIMKMPGISAFAGLVALAAPAIVLAFIPGQQAANRFGSVPTSGVSFARSARHR